MVQDRTKQGHATGRKRPTIGTRWQVYVAAAMALANPGPAAISVVVIGPNGQPSATRHWYVGPVSRVQAETQAIAVGREIAARWAIPVPIVLSSYRPAIPVGDATVRYCPARRNPAVPPSVTPLTTWLPDRVLHAAGLTVEPLGNQQYRIASASSPDRSYTVDLQAGTCACPDFSFRGLPCKHLTAAAQTAGLIPTMVAAPAAPDTQIKAPPAIAAALDHAPVA